MIQTFLNHAVIGYFSFDERLGVLEFGGIALILAGVWWSSYRPATAQKQQRPNLSIAGTPVATKGDK